MLNRYLIRPATTDRIRASWIGDAIERCSVLENASSTGIARLESLQCQGAAAIHDYMTCETVTGQGGWMDRLLALEGPYIERGFVHVNDKPGLGVDLNPDIVKAHLAPGEGWWG